jgi:hypothetical protein
MLKADQSSKGAKNEETSVKFIKKVKPVSNKDLAGQGGNTKEVPVRRGPACIPSDG